VLAPLLGPDGLPLAARDGGALYVAIERVNRIVRFDFGRAGGVPVAVPPSVATLPNSKGLEAMVVVPKGVPLAGTLIAISERGLDCARRPQGVPDRWPKPRRVLNSAPRRLRYH
jgi:hypothetical protein